MLLANATAPPEAARTLTVSARLPEADFAAIQDAVNAAEPGDTVLVFGGVYRESVTFPRPGEPGRPITVRAAPNQIALVMPGSAVQGEPRAVPDQPHVYCWDGLTPPGDLDALGLWEASSQLRMVPVSSVQMCRRRFASWYYDAQAGRLYIRSSGADRASDLLYVWEHQDRPAFWIQQPYITLDGMQAAFGAHGVLIDVKAHHVVVRNCRLFCNRSAGIHVSGDYHRIDGNETYRNNQYGIQLRYGVNHVVVAGNLSYHNGPNNGEDTDTSVCTDIGMYSRGTHVLFERNVIDGLHQCAFRNKMGYDPTNLFRFNAVRGWFETGATGNTNNTLIVPNLGVRYAQFINRVDPGTEGEKEVVDPGGVLALSNLICPAIHKEPVRFADPAYRDFRLQADSPYHGKGAYPGYAPVLYVDGAKGDDTNQGGSADAALRTLAKAVELAHPGHTIYLMPATYTEALTLPFGGSGPEEPLALRA
ncbi:MAG: right-handed parallel beta-helix repeat-containing protein, partial [Armatimonadota bacterium]